MPSFVYFTAYAENKISLFQKSKKDIEKILGGKVFEVIEKKFYIFREDNFEVVCESDGFVKKVLTCYPV